MLLHSANRSIIINPKFGLGNRLLAIAAAIRLQELSIFDHVYIQWERHNHIDVEFDDILEIDGVQFTDKHSKNNLYPNQHRICVYDETIINAYDVFTHESDQTPNPTVTKQLIQALKRVRFKQRFYAAADKWHVSDRVGLHCRRTDYPFSKCIIEKNKLAAYHAKLDIEFTEAIIASFSGPYFLASDSQQTNDYITRSIDDVIYVPKQHYPIWSTRSAETIDESIVDMILLSRCRHIVGDSMSTFSMAASWLGNITKTTWDRPPIS